LIIVDMGTATKIEAVSAAGEYLGGVIAPGLGLTLDALASRAARLYAVELKLPPAAIGTTTVTCVQAGVVMGHVAMFEGMVARVSEEMGGANEVILTGGFSPIVAGSSQMITRHEPDLTLDGLRYLAKRNGLLS
jgi:type III pantothenate kinase